MKACEFCELDFQDKEYIEGFCTSCKSVIMVSATHAPVFAPHVEEEIEALAKEKYPGKVIRFLMSCSRTHAHCHIEDQDTADRRVREWVNTHESSTKVDTKK